MFAWRAFVPGSTGPVQVWRPGYPSAPDSGYYVLLPDQAERVDDSDTRVTALTNLPEGTLVDISTTNEGTCCLPVEDSRIIFTTQDSACYGVVGQQPNGTTFDVTITAKPDFELWILPGAIRAPRANAFAERWVWTVRNECLDWMLVRGRRHLERVVDVYAAHYNGHRPHRGLQLKAPERSADARPENRGTRIVRRDVLGGLIHEYEAAA